MESAGDYHEVERTLVRCVAGGILDLQLRWYCSMRTHPEFNTEIPEVTEDNKDLS